MKFVHDLKAKLSANRFITKIRETKNVEIVIAVILALVAAVTYFAIASKGRSETTSFPIEQEVKMRDDEARLAGLISDLSGIGRSRVLITTGAQEEIVGVVVVAEGANDMANRVKMIRCVEKATGATVDQIEIFEMSNGG